MRGLFYRALCLCCCLALLCGLLPARAAQEEVERPVYRLAVTLLEARRALYVEARVEFTNDSGRTLKDLYFQLPANALRRSATAPFEESALAEAYPSGFMPGGVEFVRLTCGGEACEWGVQGEAEAVLRVGRETAPGERVCVEFAYYVLLPVSRGALGVDGLSWQICDAYPAICVFDPALDAFYAPGVSRLGSAVCTPVSDFHVTVSLPKGWKLGCTGEKTLTETRDGRDVWSIEATGVRRFALCAGAHFAESSRVTAQGVTLRALTTTPLCAAAMLDAAEKAVTLYSEWFGEYPYPELTLAQCGALTARSDTALVLLPGDLCDLGSREELRRTVFRETAKQWFSGIVGCAAAREPWLRDTLSEYAALLLTEATQGRRTYLRRLNAMALPALSLTLPGGLTVDSALERFSTGMEYEIVVIDRGVAVMHELRELMGADRFMQAMALFTERSWLGIATVADFAAALDDATGERWDEYLVGQMQTISDYAGHDITPY